MPKEKETCFIIMPFNAYANMKYEKIYIPAIEAAGFEPKRADDLSRSSNIVQDIWTFTKEATVILADLTNKNPNVFYELGLAHAIQKPAVLISASIEDVPFDLRGLRIIIYDKNNPLWGDVLKDDIIQALHETKDNPKGAVPPTFLDVSKIDDDMDVSSVEKQILEIKNEIELIKREVRSNEGMMPKDRKKAFERIVEIYDSSNYDV